MLIPHNNVVRMNNSLKDGFSLSLLDGPAVRELVGRVMAYQGDDA